MGNRLRRGEKGFTLPEVLVTIMMMVMVLFALYSIFDMGIRVFAFGNDKVEAVENARLGLQKMEREIRAAYPVDAVNNEKHLFFEANGTPSNPPPYPPTPTQITFGNELGAGGDGEITCPDANSCEYITYRLASAADPTVACTTAPCTLVRNATSTGSNFASGGQPVIEFVEKDGLAFEYLDNAGITNPSDQSDIDRVRITLKVKVEGGQQDGTQTLTTEVELRNQDIASLPSQSIIDTDGDGTPDATDEDDDGDGIPDASDSCPSVGADTANGCPNDPDGDGDGVPDDSDACPDEEGDQADGCPTPVPTDTDSDGVPDDADNCSTTSNPDQADLDSDGAGDVCDDDRDGDGVPNASDECPDSNNPGDGCPTTGISVNDVSVSEGNSGTKNASFTVTRSDNLNRTSTVDFATANGTATSGSDYDAASGTLTFAPSETTKTVNVVVRGDTTVEDDETFTLNLSNPTRGTISDGTGVGTITNDDAAPPPPTISVSDAAAVTEGNSGTKNASFTVTRTGSTTGVSTIQYATANGSATAGSDYIAASGTLTFAADETSKTVNVSVNGDTTVESNETFQFLLSSPTGATIANGTATGTIINDDSTPPPDAVNDGSATSRIEIRAGGPASNNPLTINVLNNDTGSSLNITSVTQPSVGSRVTISADRKSVIYRAQVGPGDNGDFSFTYTITDNLNRTDTATVFVKVRP